MSQSSPITGKISHFRFCITRLGLLATLPGALFAETGGLKSGFVDNNTFQAIGIGYPGIMGSGESLTRRKAAAYEAALLNAQAYAKERLGDRYSHAAKIKSFCDESPKCTVLIQITAPGLKKASSSRAQTKIKEPEEGVLTGPHLAFAMAEGKELTVLQLKTKAFAAAYCQILAHEVIMRQPGLSIPENTQSRLITRQVQTQKDNQWKIQVISAAENENSTGSNAFCHHKDGSIVMVSEGKLIKFEAGAQFKKELAQAESLFDKSQMNWNNYAFSDLVFKLEGSACSVSLKAARQMVPANSKTSGKGK